MCVEETDHFQKCSHESAVVVTICNIYANMAEFADPTGILTSEDAITVEFCPAWRRIHTRHMRYCVRCELQIQEEFRRQKEEGKKKKYRDESEADNEGNTGASSGDSWQLVVQAPPEADA
ncbi:uncharacterized protein DFL_000564 [Arthrobotrys flagrans]|uniref:Uncharacterized protein n=1 Tax=Arthrobotrys flagrans TaxID=97331 RepID=A0A437AEL0_ARTFL|nr:hypothetical protein DFL_000564 [Arthrobotrys flagrans]